MRSDALSTRDRPLEGKRVAVTRPKDGVDELGDLLRARGAVVVAAPLIRIETARDAEALRAVAAQLPDYDWVVFTSGNAVRAFREAMSCVTARAPRVAAVGAATAEVVRNELRWQVDVVPDVFSGAGLAAAMEQFAPVRNQRVLWPRAEAARDVLRQDLLHAGALLDDPVAYRTVLDRAAAAALAERARANEIDVITFTSPSAVECYAATSPPDGPYIAVIGTTTAASARAAGLTVQIQPQEHTLPALVEALADYFARARA